TSRVGRVPVATPAGALVAALLVALAVRTVVAAPETATLDAWTRLVAATEARFEQTTGVDRGCEPRSWGETLSVESGTIVDWHGHTCIPGMTVREIVERLLHPDGSDQPQEDVDRSR